MNYLAGLFILLLSAFQAKADLKILIVDTGISSKRTELTKYVSWEYQENYEDENHSGHGTHVTSLILEHACPQVTIVPCRFYTNEELLEGSTKCLKLGLKLKVNMVNMSLGGVGYSKEEHTILKKYEKFKIPVHVAMGNENEVLKKSKEPDNYYPAALQLSNLVRIGSLSDRKFTQHTNLGSNSKYYQGGFWGASKEAAEQVFLRGTSQATAYYTGLQVKKYCESVIK